MSDCLNLEVRELLPELMHGTLPPDMRASVEAHLASCQECAEELAVLQSARRVMATVTPRIDVAAIVRALPAPPGTRTAAGRRGGNLFRIAAAISFISLGGISLLVARSFFDGHGTTAASDSVASLDTSVAAADSPRVGSEPAVQGTDPNRRLELSVGGGVSDLATDDLRTLLSELEQLEAAPDAEPDHHPGGRSLADGVGGLEE